jgi:predicted ATP-binding protein involved in virulence
MYLQKAIFKNIAPFGDLHLTFNETEIMIFSGVNGKGKTTFLSYIADAFFEIARQAKFQDVLEDDTKYYRVTSGTNILNKALYSLVYLRFVDDGENFDYIEIVGKLDQTQYDSDVILEDKVPFNEFSKQFLEQKSYKSIKISPQKARDVFEKNVLTYFPSDRLEVPSWMNDIEYRKHRFNTKTRFSSNLNKNIEVRTVSDQVSNWILDVVLDWQVNKDQKYHVMIHESLNLIIQKILSGKIDTCRFGIGQRSSGQGRVVIVKDLSEGVSKIVSPSIFHLSSGEVSSLMLFAEIIRQYDAYPQNTIFQFSDIKGIVVIDEIDKHLHIKLQKEIFPNLIKLFPNLQFFISSHSPFFSLGMSQQLEGKVRFLDLNNNGLEIPVDNIDEWDDVYKIVIDKNEDYKKKVTELQTRINQGTNPLIITEGKTDITHLKTALTHLGIDDLVIDFYETTDSVGDAELFALLKHLSQVSHERKIIGIFDRDNTTYIRDIGDSKDFGNNVYAFCIPVPVDRKDYQNISIEFYFTDSELKKEKDGKSLYFNNEVEFRQSASKKTDRELIKLTEKKESEELTKKVIDEDIGSLNWIHSKTVFADLVSKDVAFSADFNFNNFNLIFEKIKEIINPSEIIETQENN